MYEVQSVNHKFYITEINSYTHALCIVAMDIYIYNIIATQSKMKAYGVCWSRLHQILKNITNAPILYKDFYTYIDIWGGSICSIKMSVSCIHTVYLNEGILGNCFRHNSQIISEYVWLEAIWYPTNDTLSQLSWNI